MKNLITFFLVVFLSMQLHAQSEVELTNEGIILPNLSTTFHSIPPKKGQLLFDTIQNKLAYFNGVDYIFLDGGGTGFWEASTHGITFNNTDNVGIGANANSGTKLFVQGDYDEDPFRVQVGVQGDPNIGSTKMRILAKYNSVVFGSSWNGIDSSHLDALWSNYKKNYFRDSLQLRNPSEDPAILMTRGSGITIFDDSGDNVIDLDRNGLASVDDLSVSEEASFGKGLISSDPIKIRELGNGPAGPEIQFMDDNSTTNVAASIKVTNSTGGGNNHNMIFNNTSLAGSMIFNADNSSTNFRMRGNINESFVTLAPVTTGNIDLGSSSLRWRTIYSQNSLNTSDVRLKRNIRELTESVLPDLLRLKVTTYHYLSDKSEDKKSVGFLAQDVERINPDWVVPPSDEDDHYLINYNDFTVLAIKAIQEQQRTIDMLSAEIRLLKEFLSK